MKISEVSTKAINNIENIVACIKGNVDVIDPFIICDKYNISVSFIDTDEPYAYNHYNPIRKGYDIYISNRVDRYSSKILCYHELGHIFCEHNKYVSLFDHKIDPRSEFIANTFVAKFLPIETRFNYQHDTTIEEYNDYVSSLIMTKYHYDSLLL